MIERIFPATEDQLEPVQSFIDGELEQYDCPPKAQIQLAVAVEEIFINIVRYAYHPEVGLATVRCSVGGDPLQVTIQFLDNGKPFNPLEVIARVKSQLRRYTALGGAEKAPGMLTVGPISMDDGSKQVMVDGAPVSLTPIEYNILKLLLSHPGQVFSSAQIYEQVWNDPAYGSENTVAVHIRHLREKIEIDPAEPRYLKVVWGLGYKIEKGGA